MRRKRIDSASSTQANSAPDQFLAELLAALPLGLIALERDGCITSVNPIAAALLGVAPESLCGHSARELVAALRASTGDSATFHVQIDHQVEALLEAQNNSSHALTLSLAIEPNRPLSLTTIDVSGQRFLVLTGHGERRANARSADDDGTTELVAAASLAMVPRLNAIDDASSALRTAPRLLDPAIYTRSVQEIADSAQQLRASLVALADILLLRRGAESLQIAPLDLTDLVMTLLAHWKTAAPSHSLELSLPGEVPGVIADARRLEQALNQLIEQVIRFTPEGESIRVTIRPAEEEILLSVRHFGRVMHLDQLKLIFRSFLPTSDADEYLGGGELGLALARAVALAHGGRLWAQLEEPNANLTVFLALPLVPLEVTPSSSVTRGIAHVTNAPTPATRLALKREAPVVVVADADARMARYLRANLEAQQYRVVIARDLEDTYRHIDLEEPDLLLLDSTLPGLEKLEALERLGSYASAPMILLAPHSDPLACARALDLGVADYVAKPFSVEELLARLRAALRTREGQTRANTHAATFTSGELHVDFSLHQVLVGEKAVQLSKTEFKLLRALAQHAGMVLAHEVLLERVWGPGYGREVDFVWVYIRRLRRKIEPNPSQPQYILTVPGVGYRLARI